MNPEKRKIDGRIKEERISEPRVAAPLEDKKKRTEEERWVGDPSEKICIQKM